MKDGKVLIIGGHSGIGAATAELLAKRNPELWQFMPTRTEVNVEARSDIITLCEIYGPFTHIVYSAGINQLAWVSDQKIVYRMEDMFSVNCAGFVALISEHILQYPNSALSAVAVSSDAAEIPMRGSVAYCASKAALNMAVKVMARELAPLHRINAVAPGMVEDTDMTDYIDDAVPTFRGWTPDQARNYERQNVPTKRRASLAEVAETIAWVLTGPAQMTGSIISINGGR